MGVHISKVRSITLDVWTADQVAHFTQLGNAKAEQIYEARLPHGFRRPSSRDSQAMELFIRNKYERRLYTQDGAAAIGATASTQSYRQTSHQPNVSSNSRAPTLGPRPNIYDMLPKRNSFYDSHGSNRNAYSYSSQFLGGGQSSNVPTSTRVSQLNPIAASLTEMGFPEQLAVEAAGRHRDLQSAADWVLRQKSVRLYSAPAVRKPELSTEGNLLNGSNTSNPPVLSVNTKPKAVPKAFGTESLLGDTIPKHNVMAASTNNVQADDDDDDDDFGDFSAFESALPSATHTPATTNSAITASAATTTNTATPAKDSVKSGTSLSASLAGLYARGPPKSPIGSTRLPMPTNPSLSQMPTPNMGMRTTAASPKFTKLANAPGTPSPPPLHTSHTNITPPPPPSTQPPTGVLAEKRNEQEEEDPFAFLTKEALTFASSKRKQKVQQTQTSNGISIIPNKESNARGSSKTTSDFTFEDLLK